MSNQDLIDALRSIVGRRHVLCDARKTKRFRTGCRSARLLKLWMLELLDKRGAQYPVENNVGHLYEAKPALADLYEQLDPTNSVNPGIGKTGKQKRYAPGTGRDTDVETA